jgi:hypothetical protein
MDFLPGRRHEKKCTNSLGLKAGLEAG